MTLPRSRWIGIGVIVAVVLVYGALMVVMATVGGDSRNLAGGGVGVVYGLVGGLVLQHSPQNRIGVLVAVMGLVPLLGILGSEVAAADLGSGLAADLAVWIAGWYFFVFIGALLMLLHVFPTGIPMPGWWRWCYRVAVVGSGILAAVVMFGPPEADMTNPFEIPLVSIATPVLLAVTAALFTVGGITGVVSLGVRFRRSRGRERAQLKWFFFTVVVAIAFPVGMGFIPEHPELPLHELLTDAAFTIPAFGILLAVTRHHLFGIDRIVSRTVTYATLALLVAAVYVIPVVVLPEVLGLSSDLAVALATLAAAAVFTPVRRRVQSVVDRRFDRERYDAERVVAAFTGQLQTAVDLGRVTDELGSAVSAALHPVAVAIWFGEGGLAR